MIKPFYFNQNMDKLPTRMKKSKLSIHRQLAPGQPEDEIQSPSVATITALMVCMRFSAWSKTIDWGDSNTSSVTSSPSIPLFW